VTPERFKEAIETVGLTPLSAHLFFGVNDRLVRRWLSGEYDIPRAVELLLELMLSLGMTAEEVGQIAGNDNDE
jgi:hypothetical protein